MQAFSLFILVIVYIRPKVMCISYVLQQLADHIADSEQYPDSLIIMGDFNKQHIPCATRDTNILDHCYTTEKDTYHSVPHAHGSSSFNLQAETEAKHVIKTVLRWSCKTEWELHAWFNCTEVFEASTTDLDKLFDTLISYISFCEDICIQDNLNKQHWFPEKLRQLHAKEDAYRNGYKILYNQARNALNKRGYSKHEKAVFSKQSDICVERPEGHYKLQHITPFSVENQLADDLNLFYCRFENSSLIPLPHQHLLQSPLCPLPVT